jgi:hypothetical protein
LEENGHPIPITPAIISNDCSGSDENWRIQPMQLGLQQQIPMAGKKILLQNQKIYLLLLILEPPIIFY